MALGRNAQADRLRQGYGDPPKLHAKRKPALYIRLKN